MSVNEILLSSLFDKEYSRHIWIFDKSRVPMASIFPDSKEIHFYSAYVKTDENFKQFQQLIDEEGYTIIGDVPTDPLPNDTDETGDAKVLVRDIINELSPSPTNEIDWDLVAKRCAGIRTSYLAREVLIDILQRNNLTTSAPSAKWFFETYLAKNLRINPNGGIFHGLIKGFVAYEVYDIERSQCWLMTKDEWDKLPHICNHKWWLHG